jgi:ubiquinone/menaquinone biosynthesis C-methylase UbiE
MSAAYDTYDYPAYWEGREYEHHAEIWALKKFLEQIPSIKSILEIGAGYGRLVPTYEFRAKKVVLTDPSAKLLKVAREKYKLKKFRFVQSTLCNLMSKFHRNSFDLVILVRVLHHIKDLEKAFEIISKLVKPGGFLILEYPNKKHFKASVKQILKGDTTYPLDIFKKDINTTKTSLPFYNYHPDEINRYLNESGFKVLHKRSVSNIRSRKAKKLLSKQVLLTLEKKLQKPFASLDFGPSIFILAQKEK